MKPHNEKYQMLLQCALDALYQTTGLTARIIEWEPLTTEGRHVDARVEIKTNNQHYDYVAEVKPVDRFVTLAEVKNQLGQYADQLLLVAPRITTEIANKCREIDLQFIDTAGNNYLRRPGLFVLVTGRRFIEGKDLQLTVQGKKRTGTPTYLRVIFALLCKPELLNAPYRNINLMAGVALGTIGWVFYDLNDRGYIIKEKDNRVLLERQLLVQEWTINYPIKLRTKLNPRRFRAQTTDWWKEVDVAQYGAQWGAEVAAEKLTGYLKPHAFTLYFHKEHGKWNLTRFIGDHRLRADPQGDIEILDAFWDFGEKEQIPETVPPLLVYADLLATLDPRNFETAKIVHEKYIATTDTKV